MAAPTGFLPLYPEYFRVSLVKCRFHWTVCLFWGFSRDSKTKFCVVYGSTMTEEVREELSIKNPVVQRIQRKREMEELCVYQQRNSFRGFTYFFGLGFLGLAVGIAFRRQMQRQYRLIPFFVGGTVGIFADDHICQKYCREQVDKWLEEEKRGGEGAPSSDALDGI
eukprot:g16631.t1